MTPRHEQSFVRCLRVLAFGRYSDVALEPTKVVEVCSPRSFAILRVPDFGGGNIMGTGPDLPVLKPMVRWRYHQMCFPLLSHSRLGPGTSGQLFAFVLPRTLGSYLRLSYRGHLAVLVSCRGRWTVLGLVQDLKLDLMLNKKI